MGMRGYLYMCVLLTAIRHYGSTGTMIKYVTMDSETIRLTCPSKHTLFNPQVLAFAFTNDISRNCSGVSLDIKARIDKCHFRKRCMIEILKKDTVYCNGCQRNVDFLQIIQPYCIPKDIIIDVGSNRTITYVDHHGVIRSHRHYPLQTRHMPKKSTVRIRIPEFHTVYMTYHTGNGRKLRDVMVFKKDRGNMTKLRLRHTKVKRFKFAGKGVKELVIKTHFRKGKRSHGFVIPFAVQSNKAIKHLTTWPKKAGPVMRDMGWIFEVRAVIEQCTVKSKGQITFSCSNDEVIYSPSVAESGYTRFEPKCMWGHYPCGGSSPGILMQKNSCYWKEKCNITWSGSSLILASRRPQCIGYQASTIGFSVLRCVNKDSIYDLCVQNCSTEIKHINANWGIIRSHSTYPWYFDPKIIECKRIIKIGDGRVLHFMIQDMNLDPDGRDRISVVHATNEDRQILMNSKSAIEGAQIHVKGGSLIVKFKPFKDSKSGRGFVLVFRRYSANSYRLNKNTSLTGKYDPELVQDEEHRGRIRLSNRRLCSGTRRYRKRGKACAMRVWTDYFTKLE